MSSPDRPHRPDNIDPSRDMAMENLRELRLRREREFMSDDQYEALRRIMADFRPKPSQYGDVRLVRSFLHARARSRSMGICASDPSEDRVRVSASSQVITLHPPSTG